MNGQSRRRSECLHRRGQLKSELWHVCLLPPCGWPSNRQYALHLLGYGIIGSAIKHRFSNMKLSLSTYGRSISLTVLVSSLAFSAHGSEVYKWVDEKGRTHYSQRDDSAGNRKAEQLKISVPPPSASAPIAADVRASAARAATRPPNAQGSANARPATARSVPAWHHDAIETDASKCKLARSILSGSARHGNGAPTDTYDRQVAESDVRSFCSK